jgi:putative ubiquitin-RnfH superfamily antitoxin RatB of RatAB toxin-antitoxin module
MIFVGRQIEVTTDTIEIEVLYADLDKVWRFPMRLPRNSSVADALAVAKKDVNWPGIEINADLLAVYGQAATLQTKLHEFDRVEILRPLVVDPMDARRGRVVKKAKR